MANNCIEQHTPYLAARHKELVDSGMQDKEAAIKVAIEEHKKLHDELNDFKKSISPDPKKFKPSEYISPDTSQKVKEIKDTYDAKIKEAKKDKKETEEKLFTKNALDRADAKKIYQQVREVDVATDAAQVALEYIANGGKISEGIINEIAGTVKRVGLNTGAKEKRSSEYNNRDYADKGNETLDGLAHRLWEANNQRIPETEIKDALMDVVNSHNTRLDAAKSYLERYSAEYNEKQMQEKFYQEHLKEIEDEIEFLNSQADLEKEAMADENYVTKLIEKYETESKGQNQQSSTETTGGINEGMGNQEGTGKETESNQAEVKTTATNDAIAPNKFSIQSATTEAISDMRDIVKDYVDEGTASLQDIQNDVAKELGDNSQEMKDLVEKAYNEFYKTKESTPKEVTGDVIGRVGKFLSRLFGGTAASKVFIAKDEKALMQKYDSVVKDGDSTSFQMTMPDGSKQTVKRIDVDVVNGFYSPLEKTINEFKGDKLPVKQWTDKFKGEEAKWTGLTDWLSQQEGSVSKADIQKYLKENRIQVVEVVKSDDNRIASEAEILDAVYSNDWVELGNGVRAKGDVGGFSVVEINGNKQRLSRVEAENLINKELSTKDKSTKFQNYQLEGEKESYKEVLVTMPNNDKAEVSKIQDGFSKKFFDKNYSELTSEEKKTIDYQTKSWVADNPTKGTFKSGHFDEPNILVHLRMNTRTDADGNKVLFLEEVQSDFNASYRKSQDMMLDYVNKNENEVIELYKKSGKLKVIC